MFGCFPAFTPPAKISRYSSSRDYCFRWRDSVHHPKNAVTVECWRYQQDSYKDPKDSLILAWMPNLSALDYPQSLFERELDMTSLVE